MRTQEFTLDWQLPSRNKVDLANRRNRYVGAKMKHDITGRIAIVIKSLMQSGQLRPIENPCIVSVLFTEPTRRQDVDNVGSAVKFLLDGMQEAGLIQGDSPRYVIAVPTWVQYGEKPSVHTTIIEDCTDALFSRVNEAQDVLRRE